MNIRRRKFSELGIFLRLKSKTATTPDQAVEAAKFVSDKAPWVVKAQIHAGGRGKGGGVKLAKTLDEVKKYATEIMSKNLVTHQTTSAGQKVSTLLIEEGCNIAKEYYLGRCAWIAKRHRLL
jgi:succinyl-CoA synthetase beta subunit